MKILITGMTSRTTSEKRSMAFTALLARQLRRMGHDVDLTWIRDKYESVREYDAVLVGVSSPLSPSATYTIPALLTIHQARMAGNLSALIVDDPDARKIIDGTTSLLRKPTRLSSTYYEKRPGSADLRPGGNTRTCVLTTSAWVLDDTETTILWPAHPWASSLPLSSVFAGGSERLTGIDVTAPLLALAETKEFLPQRLDRMRAWMIEIAYAGRSGMAHKAARGITKSVRQASLTVKTDDTDITAAVEAYQLGYGITQPNIGDGYHGWWTPTPALALSLANTIYVPPSNEGLILGGHLYRLPYQLEGLDDYDYDLVLAHQQAEFMENSWPSSTLSTHLNGVIGPTGS